MSTQVDYTSRMAGGADTPPFISESKTNTGWTCTFDTELDKFIGALHVRFQASCSNASVIQKIDGTSIGMITTLPVQSGVTHYMIPVVITSGGTFSVEVTPDTAATPSNTKYDLVGINYNEE